MNSYTWSYKLLHWLMALLIFIMFLALQGFSLATTDEERMVMLIGHSSIGTIITVLMLLRVTKRFVLKHEQPKHELASAQAKAAKLVHYALYFLMLLVPLTGYLSANYHHLPVQLFASFSLNGDADAEMFDTLRLIHSTSVKALMGLVLLHVVAALGHKFIKKDDIVYSMRPWFKRKS